MDHYKSKSTLVFSFMFTNFEIMDELNAKIEFHAHEISFTLRNRKKLKSFILSIFKQETGKTAFLSYVFCTDKYLLEMNRQYLDHDYYTDIITFDLSESSEFIIGEVYISIDRVKENARQNKTPFSHELHRVIFHGALHLTGQNDKTTEQSLQMTKKEDFYLSQYFN